MNKSGIYPVGKHVLVFPDEIKAETKGGILIPETEITRHQQAVSTGLVVAMGEDAYTHGVTDIYRAIDGVLKLVERHVDRTVSQYAKVGDRVVFSKFSGKEIPGMDGKEYRLMNDTDISCLADESVKFGTFDEYRKRVSK